MAFKPRTLNIKQRNGLSRSMVETGDQKPRPRWKRPAIAAVKLVVAALVLWGVGRHVARAWDDLGRRGESLRIEPLWLVVSGALYLAGLTLCGIFFEQILRASPSPVRRYASVRAYLISHLGKYVPGKAMVVVVRAGMVVPFGARGVTAAIATFYETLVMMAAGGLVAAVGFGSASSNTPTFLSTGFKGWEGIDRLLAKIPLFAFYAVVGLALGLAFLVVVWPPVFRRLTRLVTTPFGGVGSETSPAFSGRLLVRGLLWTTACWILLGLSQAAVIRAVMPLDLDRAVSVTPLAVASVAIATVAGFVVAVLPGGLGVREGVLMAVLGPVIGEGVAVASALLLRLVWIAAELLAGLVLFAIRPHATTIPAEPLILPPEPQAAANVALAETGQHPS